jgi:hypothetical protein
MFLGYGYWVGYVVAANVGLLIFGLYNLFTSHLSQTETLPSAPCIAMNN